MDNQYTAFISYRHHKLDSEVARDVQRSLEHFHIPKSIRKLTGRKELGRVFRDQEELPITADLNETILQALDNSVYLIVICSTHTSESQWVRREINYFLKHHDRNHVFTVLADGEPYEVIPENLTHEDRIITEDGGSEHTEHIDFEPLSCDYRKKRRDARREEIPRLAAAILGIPYDSLIQRARQYRIRRITVAATTVAAVSIIAAAYLFWSRARIAESLRQAQINQSKYLSGEVESLLDEDRDVTAARLAIHTVPEDRSLTPAESWKALADASGAYIPETTISNAQANTRVVGELHSQDRILYMRENHERSRICTVDATNHIHVWDAEKRKDILSFQDVEDVQDIVIAGNVLVVGTEEELRGYDLSDESVIWTIKRGISFQTYDNVRHSLQTTGDETEVIVLNVDPEEHSHYLTVVSTEDGTVLKDVPLKDTTHEDADGQNTAAADVFAYDLHVSDDGTTMAFEGRTDGEGYNESDIWFYNLESDKLWKSDLHLYNQDGMDFLENGSLIVRGHQSEEEYKKANVGDNGYFYGLTTMSNVSDNVYCVSAETGEIKWTSDIEYDSYSGNRNPVYTGSFAYSGGSSGEAVYVTASDVLQIYDAETGEKLNTYRTSADIEYVGLTNGSSAEDTSLGIMCSDGARGVVSVGEPEYAYVNLLYDDVSQVFYYKLQDETTGWFAIPDNGSTVLQYTLDYSDTDFELFTETQTYSSIPFFDIAGESYVAVRSPDEDGDTSVLEIYDREKKSLKKSYPIYAGQYFGTGQGFVLGLTEDQNELLYYCDGNSSGDTAQAGVYAISLENGTSRAIPIPVKDLHNPELSFNDYYSKMCLLNNRIYYVSTGGHFCTYDLSQEELQDFTFLEKEDSGELLNSNNTVCALSISPDRSRAFISLEDGTSLLLDLEQKTTETVFNTEEPLFTGVNSASSSVDWDEENGLIAAAGEREVCVFQYDGTLMTEISFSGTQAQGVHFYKDELFVAYTDGKLNRYMLSDGTLLGSTDVAVYSASSRVTDNSEWIIREDGTLCLFLSSYATIVDINEWTAMYSVPNCVAVDTDNRQFVTYEGYYSDEYKMGYFPEYTLDDLIEKCRKAGGGEELDHESIARYGLTEE